MDSSSSALQTRGTCFRQLNSKKFATVEAWECISALSVVPNLYVLESTINDAWYLKILELQISEYLAYFSKLMSKHMLHLFYRERVCVLNRLQSRPCDRWKHLAHTERKIKQRRPRVLSCWNLYSLKSGKTFSFAAGSPSQVSLINFVLSYLHTFVYWLHFCGTEKNAFSSWLMKQYATFLPLNNCFSYQHYQCPIISASVNKCTVPEDFGL